MLFIRVMPTLCYRVSPLPHASIQGGLELVSELFSSAM